MYEFHAVWYFSVLYNLANEVDHYAYTKCACHIHTCACACAWVWWVYSSDRFN